MLLLLCALLLASGVVVAETNTSVAAWTYNVKCNDCAVINTFHCANSRVCPYEIRRCLTVSIRVNARELLVYKNCTTNCTFVYQKLMPAEAPRVFRTNSFYWVLCCGGMSCNEGGPSNLERDILPDEPIEEVIERAVHLGGSELFLSLASILLSRTLT